MSTPLIVAVIIGSTRQGRVGASVGAWFTGLARGRAEVDVRLIDLADFQFPQRFPNTPTPSTARFNGLIAVADAFVIVTPEYNRSFPASVKQAIDLAYDEWQAKPVGFVSYGCGSDGIYAVEALRTVFTELQAVSVRNSVGFNLLDKDFTQGEPAFPDRATQAANTMLDQLGWWGRALRDARARHPYVS